jgi:hypothetical protein
MSVCLLLDEKLNIWGHPLKEKTAVQYAGDLASVLI